MISPRLLILFAVPFLSQPQSNGVVLLGSDLADGFYGDEPPFEVGGDRWLGLFRNGTAYSLRPTLLEWIGLDRPEGSDGPTFELSSSPANPVVLFSAIPALGEGVVNDADPWTTSLSARTQTVALVLGTSTYQVSVAAADASMCDAIITLSDGTSTQALQALAEAPYGCDEPHFTIHWAGDLDGDERLDLVTTFSPKYSYHPRRLYLSSLAGPGELVAAVATTDRTAS